MTNRRKGISMNDTPVRNIFTPYSPYTLIDIEKSTQTIKN